MGGEVVQDPELLQVCAEYFQKLLKSRVESIPDQRELKQKVETHIFVLQK